MRLLWNQLRFVPIPVRRTHCLLRICFREHHGTMHAVGPRSRFDAYSMSDRWRRQVNGASTDQNLQKTGRRDAERHPRFSLRARAAD